LNAFQGAFRQQLRGLPDREPARAWRDVENGTRVPYSVKRALASHPRRAARSGQLVATSEQVLIARSLAM
jgi:hypothetical protein